MKKYLAFFLAVLILCFLPSGMTISTGAVTFKDVPEDAWYYEHVQYVANHPNQLMVGNAGNFGPLDNLTVEQMIKIVVAAAGKSVTVPSGEYWGDVYVSKGLELGIVQPGEFDSYRREITRAEMAKIIIRALPLVTGEKEIQYSESDIRSRMLDYDSIPVDLREYVCKAYQLGILVGGSDGYFRPNEGLTRASAAAVIHKMLEPSIRTVYTPPEEIWSDEEFEEYIKENADKFYSIAKIEDRKMYLRTADKPTPTLLSDKNNPYIHEILYECAKTMAYYAKKNGNVFSIAYSDFFGGYVALGYHIISDIYDPDIKITIYAEPQMNYHAEKYAPGRQKNPSYYCWIVGALRDPDFLSKQGWVPGMTNRHDFMWTQEKYEKIFKHLCQIVYGPTQGKAFYDFVFPKYQEIFYSGGIKEDSYFGIVPNAGIELAYYYSHENHVKSIEYWTTIPEVRK